MFVCSCILLIRFVKENAIFPELNPELFQNDVVLVFFCCCMKRSRFI